MGYFLTTLPLQLNQDFWLEGEEANHLLSSRRIRLGEHIELQDPQLNRFVCEVLEVQRHKLQLTPQSQSLVPEEPSLKLWLYQAMIKEKPLDWVLQKSVELGAARVVLFQSEHAQPLPKAREQDKKLSRWQKILNEAAKQSGRAIIPELIIQDQNVLAHPFDGPAFVFDPYKPATALKSIERPLTKAHLILGPEGGFSREELESFQGTYLSLGPRILRAETAALTALALFGGFFGDLDC